MLTIKQMLESKIGERFGDVEKIIKTCKKKWQTDGKWIQQVVITDTTGDILADVNIGKNIPLIRGTPIKIIVAEIQSSEKGNKVYIDQFSQPTSSEPDLTPYDQFQSDWEKANEKIIRSKIKCWLVAAKIQSDVPDSDAEEFSRSEILNKIVDNIMKG